MSSIYLMTVITPRDSIQDFYDLYAEHNLSVSFVALGRGTASESAAEIFGLKNNENAVAFTLVTGETWESMKKDFYLKLRLDTPGSGIAIISPISSVGGEGQFAYLMSGQKFERGEESVLKNTERELLIAICNQGYNKIVMDAARTAGAKGGTVIHAIGTGIKKSEEFLGVSLATEKELVLIIVNEDQKRPMAFRDLQ